MTSSASTAEPARRPVLIPMQDFRVDGWLVQPTCNRLVKGATAIRVRPQLIDVLACLAMQPGKVMSKNQLLAVVWSDRHVEASGVTRCVAELRQALADDARQPRVIETIPKRGYRLIAPVEPVGGPDVAPASESEPPRPSPAAPHAAGSVSGDAPGRPGGAAAATDQPLMCPAGAAAPRRFPQFGGLMSAARAFLATGGALSLFVHYFARRVQR